MIHNSIDHYFQEYLRGLAQLDILLSRMQSTIESAWLSLDANRAVTSEKSKEKDTHFINHVYRDISTGKPNFFSFTSKGFEEEKRDLFWTKNKLYQFALLEAFELFESFVKAVYVVYKPVIDPTKQIKNDGSLSRKLHILRKSLPTLAVLERRNAVNANYRSAIAMIECLRHIIVHRSGRIRDRKLFSERLRSIIQSHNDGNIDVATERECLFYMMENDKYLEVFLLEHYEPESNFVHISRLRHLTDILSSYAGCLASLLNDALSKRSLNTP